MTEQEVFISICIPAYKRTDFLKRLLDSIVVQTFRSFEVIIADDSPGNEVKQMADDFSPQLPFLFYHRNSKQLGTPSNWNEAVRHARGEWIKIMHDDDWFSGPGSLARFADAAKKEKNGMIFSSYFDVFLATGKVKRIIPPAFRFRRLRNEPATLLSRNIIGPPSVMMHRNDGLHCYDPGLKWLVDIDMYVRRLEHDKIVYLPEPLVKVGVGTDQVTASVHGAPDVEVPEYFQFLHKTGIHKLKNILVYDAWWRFVRNFQLFSEAEVRGYGYKENIHPVLLNMMRCQKRLPLFILKIGIFSKAIMFFHFLLNRNKLSQ